jgi:mRNA interferase RelE/StbE
MARVRLTDEARDDLQDLDRSVQIQVLKGLKKLKTNPEQRGAPLGRRSTSNLTTFRKLVVGDRDYRIIYRVEVDGSVVVVWVIGRRPDGEAYELALTRLRLHENAAVRELAASLEELWELHPDED